MNDNDKRILELKEKLAIKKENLEKSKTEFVYRTNCNFELFGIKYNIHAMTEVELKIMFNNLKALNEPNCKLGNFTISDFLSDIMTELVKMDYSKSCLEIKRLEKGLDELISNELKTSIEIDKIAKIIENN